jgi:hypothetical protein
MNPNVGLFFAFVFEGSYAKRGTRLLLEGTKILRRLIAKRKGVGSCLSAIEGKDCNEKKQQQINP